MTAIRLVKVVDDAELAQNGGIYVLQGNVAWRVEGFQTDPGIGIAGGAIMPVYIVPTALLNNGTFGVVGNAPLLMGNYAVLGGGDRPIAGNAALPVYVQTGSLDAEEEGYYVNFTGGNDSNSGQSSLAPWKTLSKVSGFTFASGDKIFLKRNETWNETLTVPRDTLTFSAYSTGALPIIHGQDTRTLCVDCTGRTGLTIQNLTVRNATVSNILFTAGTNIVNGVTALNSGDQNFQNQGTAIVTYNDCTSSGAADDGFSFHSNANVTINRCIITLNNVGMENAVGAAVVIVNDSQFISNVVNDISADPTLTIAVNRCKFSGMAGANRKSVNAHGSFNYCLWDLSDSIQTNTQIASVTPDKPLILNNCTIYGWSGSDTRGGMTAAGNCEIELNNVIADRMWRLGYISAGASINADYCNFNGITSQSLTTNTNAVVGNPLLTDPANDDFTLQAGSPCINAGKNLGFTTDIDGNPVVPPPDLGAYERQS